MQKKIKDKNFVYKLANLWIIENNGFAKILTIDHSIIQKTTKLFIKQQIQRKTLSFTDCTNVILCQENNILTIGGFDEEFNQYLDCVSV